MNANQLGKLVCAGVGAALIAAACAGRSLNDVGDIDGKAEAGEGGTNGVAGEPSGDGGRLPKGGGGAFSQGGKGGASPQGGTGTAGSDDVPEAGSPGGGGAPLSGCYEELFRFDEVGLVTNTSSGPAKKWSKSPYDSTDTKTGNIQMPAGNPLPPNNPTNLANMSLLGVTASAGDPAPAMLYSIPISPSQPKAQVVNLLYVFAGYGQGMDAVDLSKTSLKARVMLAEAPHENCQVDINAWTTGTDPGGLIFNHVDGPKVRLSAETWVTIEMDLDKSSPASRVNQLGFVLKTNCTQPVDIGAGGAGGAGGLGEAGGASGAGYEGDPTVVLFDEIEIACD